MTRRRLDAELVRRGLVSSREQGRAAIEGARVSVSGVTATKAATQVDDAAPIELVAEPGSDFVSRGAHKLIGGLDAFGLDVRIECAGRRSLDWWLHPGSPAAGCSPRDRR